MTNGDKEKLLEDKRVIDEINRHLWIESEKAGYDIGFERAAEDWLNKYANEWVKFNDPANKGRKKTSVKSSKPRKRGAKSYVR